MVLRCFQAEPFLMRRPNVDGSDEYVGFIPDLFSRLSERLGVHYRVGLGGSDQHGTTLVSDGKYGARTSDGLWNGMIGELVMGVSWL